MTEQLEQIGSVDRHQYVGTFVKYGFKAYHEKFSPTLLLKDIKLKQADGSTQIVANHLWFNLTKGFQGLGHLTAGTQIAFNARVDDYSKDYYLNRKHDWKLSRPTKVKFVKPPNEFIPVPANNHALVGMIMSENFELYRQEGRQLNNFCLNAFTQFTRNYPGYPVKPQELVRR